MPLLLDSNLDLPRCPHCGVDSPNLRFTSQVAPKNWEGIQRFWRMYICTRCAGITSAESWAWGKEATSIFPQTQSVSEDIPSRARAYLMQAADSLNVPAGAVMLAASSVDAMLKAKGLTQGSLYARIGKSVELNLITKEMADWAHDVRLDANDQRHVDEEAELPNSAQARKCVDFSMALAQFLFVLPARVQRGIQIAKTEI